MTSNCTLKNANSKWFWYRKLCVEAIIILSVGAVTACNPVPAGVPVEQLTAEEPVDQSEQTILDINNIVSDIEDGTTSMFGSLNAEFVSTTRDLAENISPHIIYNIVATKLALERSSNAQVRNAATTSLSEYVELSETFAQAIHASNIPIEVPAEMNERHQSIFDNLLNADVDQFDARFVRQQVNTLREALTILENYALDGVSPPVREFAAATVPAMQRRLSAAKTLDQMLSGGGSN